MDLREYLFRHDMKVTEFSKLIGYQRSYINKIAKGTLKPGKRLADVIEKATNGEVKAEEMIK